MATGLYARLGTDSIFCFIELKLPRVPAGNLSSTFRHGAPQFLPPSHATLALNTKGSSTCKRQSLDTAGSSHPNLVFLGSVVSTVLKLGIMTYGCSIWNSSNGTELCAPASFLLLEVGTVLSSLTARCTSSEALGRRDFLETVPR